MRLSRIEVKNFRLLQNVALCLEDRSTVIVGRNNSGKTSLTELFRRFISDRNPVMRLEDFSLGAHEDFWNALNLWRTLGSTDAAIKVLPVIELRLTISYDKTSPTFGPLSPFIIDLDPNCTDALVSVKYGPDGQCIKSLFKGFEGEDTCTEESRPSVFRTLKEQLERCYSLTVTAIDPNDETNQRQVDRKQLTVLLQGNYVSAQRGLDDATLTHSDVLGRVLEALYKAAKETSDQAAADLQTAVSDVQAAIDGDFKDKLKALVPSLKNFGYPGLSDAELITETILDVESLLTHNTKIRYPGLNGVTLPEAYNGLGSRNLIFMLLQLHRFLEDYQSKPIAPGVHLVFIEEPEAHLHPQMQEVFIRQLESFAAMTVSATPGVDEWPVQFVVSTHSASIANEAPFEKIRYFTSTADVQNPLIRTTEVKDLHVGMSGDADRAFLHKYLTLTRNVLFFADKAILIEGPSERLFLPNMISETEAKVESSKGLASQYITAMEVGGAYAHKFYHLLDFLELPTLIITDIDSVNGETLKACKVSEGTRSSNACINDWFGDTLNIPALHSKQPGDKVRQLRRIAYQIPETDLTLCGRSLEAAFILANQLLFADAITNSEGQDVEEKVWSLTNKLDKTDFALQYGIDVDTVWHTPLYISEGLVWLAQAGEKPQTDPSSQPVTAISHQEANDA